MVYSFKTKITIISAIVLMWFVFGTLMILRGSIDISKLKRIEGKLDSYKIVTIPGHKQKIDVLTFNVSGYSDRTALYLNSRQDYSPLIEKFNTNEKIKIVYNDKGGLAADGYNLHIYQIDYGNETLIHFDKITSTDKKVGVILYFVGLIFGLPIIYLFGQKRKKSSR
jgi:hypothetical protein